MNTKNQTNLSQVVNWVKKKKKKKKKKHTGLYAYQNVLL